MIVLDENTEEVLTLRSDPQTGAPRLWWRRRGSPWTIVERPGVRDPLSVAANLPVPLRVAIFSDCRAQEISLILDFMRALQPKPHLIIYGGDDIDRFVSGRGQHLQVLAGLSTYGVAVVLGNDDPPTLRAHLAADRIYDVHSQPLTIGGLLIAGMEGSPFDRNGPICRLQYREQTYVEHLAALDAHVAGHPTILVSHAPPRGVLDLAQRYGRVPIGSKALRSFLSRRPEVVLVACGHVHKQGGRHRAFKSATVVNAASHDGLRDPARVATVEFEVGSPPEVRWHQLHGIAGIYGLWPPDQKLVRRKGLHSLDAFVDAGPARLGSVLGWRPKSCIPLIARADALRRKTPVPFAPLAIPAGPRIWLDIETDQFQRYVWLIGVYEEGNRTFRRFFARRPTREPQILKAFSTWLAGRPHAVVLTYSGSRFDERILTKRLRKRRIPVPGPLKGALDCLHLLQRSVGLPTSYMTLKEVAASLGYRYKHPDLDGLEVAAEYVRAVDARRPIPGRLLRYNQDDVMSLRFVIRTLEDLGARIATTAEGKEDLA